MSEPGRSSCSLPSKLSAGWKASRYVPFATYPEKDLSGALSPNAAQTHAKDFLQTLKLKHRFLILFSVSDLG